ncbi:uncharacterized protein GIQ15_05851 [Arthroderma uncinatum]|uniref:uncharacterized protein n=1 Tax=Arthroderma uncinatum TaxID=74035 RepID=UPI00144AD79D|nr:uncharacterized protein GIQ15_05851 [Arthroderma uncinatum]KAF3480504.1 hypothetical protein GIQ15_05851 [Arthroderma uncinatum]
MLSGQYPKKAFTCFYWVNGGCRHSADQCKFVHEYTERVAKPPKPPRYAWRDDRPETKNLIDLLSNGGDSSDSKDFNSVATSDQAIETVRPAKIVARAIESGHDYELVKELLTNYSHSGGKDSISPGEKLEILLAVIRCDRPDLVELVIENGADPNGVVPNSEIPLLGSAILNRNSAAVSIVNILLASGADPHAIPKSLWEDGIYTSHDQTADEDDESIDSGLKALTDTLAESANVSIRHSLLQASKTLPPLPANVEMYLLPFIKRITRAEHTMIGQRVAIEWIKKFLTLKFMTRMNSPLVMAFVGPAGHGKSSLAKELGTFIPLSKLQKVDDDDDDDEEDAPHNTRKPTNALGELQVLFVDNNDIAGYQRLLSFLDGDDTYYYVNKGEKTIIDKSNTLCIIATTHGEERVLGYHRKDMSKGEEDNETHPENIVHCDLEAWLGDELEKGLGTSLAGHVGCIIPFFPFSKAEATVLAHSYLLKATDALAEFHDSLHQSKHGELDNITFCLDADIETCERLAKVCYVVKQGARSIEQGIFRTIQPQMMYKYLESDLVHDKQHHDGNTADRGDRYATVVVREDISITLE